MTGLLEEMERARLPHALMNTAIIFDLDGTLVDTLADIAAAMNHVLRRHELPTHSLDAYRGFIGMGALHLVRSALPAACDGEAEHYLEAFRERYTSHLTDRSQPYPGVPELLRELGQQGMPMSVLSNKPHGPTERLVATLFAPSTFHTIRGHRAGAALKPDPSEALRVADAMGGSHFVFVGDSEVDMQTALAASMTPIGVSWGLRSATTLEKAGAKVVIDEPWELLELVGG